MLATTIATSSFPTSATEPMVLAFKTQGEQTKPETSNTEKRHYLRTIHINTARPQSPAQWKPFNSSSILGIQDVLGKKGRDYFLQPTAFISEGNFNVEALVTLVDFINNSDSELAKDLNRNARLNLVSKLINQSFKFNKPEYDPIKLARKLITSLPGNPHEFNSSELKVLEDPKERKEFIRYLLQAAASAQNNYSKPALKIGMNDFSKLQEALSNIKKLTEGYEKQYALSS